MPKTIQNFAQQSLIQPIIVNVGRAGAANLDVIQEVEYVKQEAKMVYLLECLQKTPPPVIVFSDNKNEVDGAYIWASMLLQASTYADPPLSTRLTSYRHPGVPLAQGRRGSRHPRIKK
jgi:superfamily II DNA/RNA helicase